MIHTIIIIFLIACVISYFRGNKGLLIKIILHIILLPILIPVAIAAVIVGCVKAFKDPDPEEAHN